MKKRQTSCAAAAAIVLAVAATAPAADLYWGGGTGDLNSANYYTATTGPVAPGTTGDFVDVGADGIVTVADGQSMTIARARIGHNFTGGGTQGLPGAATLNMTGGTLTLAGTTGTGGVNGGLIVGYNNSGTVNLSGGTITVARFVNVGYDNPGDTTSNAAGTLNAALNISGTGTLTITNNNLNVGQGVAGSVSVSDGGSLNVAGSGVDLVVGVSSTSSFTQTGGTTTVAGTLYGGRNAVSGSSIAISGGTVTAGSLDVADNGGADTTLTTSGTAAVTTSGHITVGGTTATGSVWNISDGAHVTVGAPGAKSNVFLGRGTSSNTTFNMTGGTLDVAQFFLMGTAAAPVAPATYPTATGIVGTQSAGTITTGSNFVIADSGGDSTYNLGGTGTVNVGGRLLVGRRNATAVMNQTAGSLTASFGVRVADQQPDATKGEVLDMARSATGTYNISGGTLTAAVPAGNTADALSVAAGGIGTFRVIGGDAGITVTGNVAVNNTVAGVGTLAYQLQAGEGLTKINATGTATFAAGSVLSFDPSAVASPASSYDLITAAGVVNGGLVLSAPAGWHVDLVDGATGKTLQILQAINGDANRNGKIDADDYALLDRGAAQQAQWWHNGDFNDNGVIDSQDYLLIDTAFGQQNGGHFAPGFLAARESEFGAGYVADLVAAVPEPGTLSVLAAGLLPLLGRRRRSR